MPGRSPAPTQLYHLSGHRAGAAHDYGPQLAAALRKVTANLRGVIEKEAMEGDEKNARGQWLVEAGVLEAEALLKRIDEGGNRG